MVMKTSILEIEYYIDAVGGVTVGPPFSDSSNY
jgi:hypothetical protein